MGVWLGEGSGLMGAREEDVNGKEKKEKAQNSWVYFHLQMNPFLKEKNKSTSKK